MFWSVLSRPYLETSATEVAALRIELHVHVYYVSTTKGVDDGHIAQRTCALGEDLITISRARS